MRFLTIWLCTILFSTTLLASCSPKPKVQADDLANMTVFYTDSENQTQFVDFNADSAELASLKTWLEENKNGWKNYTITLPVGDITITSQGMSLTIGDDWLIMREGTGTDSVRQLEKKISTSDLELFQSFR